ncbi:hypothetical protein THOM_1523 [Trachipleistophora hominis]|uniref:RRM domain-containing protein n=1 Tax=Trachipleistophora hominis TaxID=72359 RepID=L7JVM9_TRAHO|nr:hypothetical protein THOM_1523 [Trachipleistophora hominis]
MTVTQKMKNVKRVYEKTKDRSRDDRSKKRTITNKSRGNNESVFRGGKNGMKDGDQELEKENKRKEVLKGAKDKFDRRGDQKLEKEKNTVKTTEELKNKFVQRRDNESKKERNIKKSIKETNCRSASTKDKEQRNDENIRCKEDKKRKITNNELLIKCNGKEKENIESKIKRDSNAESGEKRVDAGCSVVYSPKNRLILRKVPHTTEQEILSHFQLADKARMLMKNDKFTGTVFLQFMNYKKTKKTLEDESLRNFNGHTIEIDYCLPREVYLKKKHLYAENAEDKQENGEKRYDKMKSCDAKEERSKIGETNCKTKKDGVDDTTEKIKRKKET